ncbi:MAG: hypothetical protein KME60_15230 [Cyanomargarita calcarea GSE-NOS-MK-12-04C]|jgi:hypothetical protein|uniref:Uncharacterized protein n=1 Tax=Cyanomargarita calcarea GSE-NOS-MK-12-04C TaxID=2839659 RepID=A0A951QML4_9CYAN|nr:hypothetical protein [Cyanomargarita calcarea GSE-NOS-MK-12-04C]
MPYSEFTLSKAKKAFDLTIVEGSRFFPEIEYISPSPRLASELEDLPWTIAVGSEKARSEAIVYPVLQEVRRILNRQISLFSGREFNVDLTCDLTGYVDFLISRSPEQLIIEAPVVVVTEAKKADLNEGLGQCLAEMVAAQRFNETSENIISTIYGVVSSGTQWRFMKLERQTVTIDLTDYPLLPADQILGFLVWMVKG